MRSSPALPAVSLPRRSQARRSRPERCTGLASGGRASRPNQPQDREGVRPHDSAIAPGTGRSGDRVVLRRAFMGVLTGGLLAAPRAAETQPGKVYRLGYLTTSGTLNSPYAEASPQGLRDLGWVEGQNIVIEFRPAEGRLDRLPALATELVRLKVDVIVATPTPGALGQERHRNDSHRRHKSYGSGRARAHSESRASKRKRHRSVVQRRRGYLRQRPGVAQGSGPQGPARGRPREPGWPHPCAHSGQHQDSSEVAGVAASAGRGPRAGGTSTGLSRR